MRGKRKGKRVIMQIKGDNKQNLKTKEFGVKQLEKVYDEAKQQIPQIPEIYQKIKESMSKAYDQADQKIQFDRGRADFHIHAIVANRTDQVLLCKRLTEIHDELKKQNDVYKEEIQKLQFQQQEMENNLKSQIESVAHQLKSLQPFKDRRKMLIEQKKALEHLIYKEKQIHQDELTDIHHKLLDQREYYEKELRARLEAAEKFAQKYSDLHIDLLTKKISDSTSTKRKDLNSLDIKLLNEFRDADNLIKTKNYYIRQNQIIRKSIENSTAQIIQIKQEKKDVELYMLQAISNHEEEISKTKDILKEKEDYFVNFKIFKLHQENERLKKEASESFELMKKTENCRLINDNKSFEIDLLLKMKNVAVLIIKALDHKFGPLNDSIYLDQKTPMGKLIRRLFLLNKNTKKNFLNSFYETEPTETSNNSYLESENDSDLKMNVDYNEINELLDDINENVLFDSNSKDSNCFSTENYDESNNKENGNINNESLGNYDENYKKEKENNNNENLSNNDENENNSNFNDENSVNYNDDSFNNENLSDKKENYSNYNDDNSSNFSNENDKYNNQNKNAANDKIKNNMNNYNKVSKVSVGVQTEKLVISTLLKGYKAPPTPPNYPYQFRSELSNTKSNSNKPRNLDKKRHNYLYYTYANTHANLEKKTMNDENDADVNDSTKGENYKPQPPNVPVSNQSKTRMRSMNIQKNNSNKTESLNSSRNSNKTELLNSSRNSNKTESLNSSRNSNKNELLNSSRNSNKNESLNSPRNSTPRRKRIQRYDYAVTPEFKNKLTKGRTQSENIRIIRTPK